MELTFKMCLMFPKISERRQEKRRTGHNANGLILHSCRLILRKRRFIYANSPNQSQRGRLSLAQVTVSASKKALISIFIVVILEGDDEDDDEQLIDFCQWG